MCVDGEGNREHDGDSYRRGVGKRAVLDRDDGEDDRSEPSRAEPTDEGDRLPLGMGSEERDGDRQHAHDGEAEKAIECCLPSQAGEHRPDDRSAEDQEGRTFGQDSQLVQ